MIRAPLFSLFFVFSSTLAAQQLIISTVAGGVAPVTPFAAAQASLGDPARVAVDAAGSVYFSSLHSVFKVDVNGIVTRVAGNGRYGNSGDGNAATAAQLAAPDGVAVDTAGNVYVADRDANVVRVIAASGAIGTAAGNGTAGFSGDGGLAVNAQLNGPTGIALDSGGSLYISDSGNNVIRRVLNGNISTYAGSGTEGFGGDGNAAAAAALDGPEGIAVDAAGSLYIADTFNNRVRQVAANGTITTIAGTGASAFSGDAAGPAASASLFLPTGVAVDSSGTLYIADYGNSRIRTVTKGVIATVIGSKSTAVVGDDEPALSVRLNGPTGVAIDSSGTIYFAEGSVGTGSGLAAGDYKVWKLPATGVVFTAAGNGIQSYSGDGGQATAAQLNTPSGLALDSAGNLYFADTLNNRVRRVSPAGAIDTVAGTGSPGFSGDAGPAASAQLNGPQGIAIDRNGNLYIADTKNNRIRKVSRDGAITTLAGNGNAAFFGDGGPATVAALHAPRGVAVDLAGNVYIADTLDQRAREVQSNGTIVTIAGNGSAGLSGEGGPAADAQLNGPSGVAVDSAGNLYIADAGNARIRVVSPSGNISTAVGGNAEANGQLASPESVALDAAGNLYISDTGHSRVLMVSASAVTTLGGNGTCCYSGDGGPAGVAQLNAPTGIAIDPAGRVYVADTGNNAIRLIQSVASGGLPTITAITNGASNVIGPVSPGEIVVVYGSGLGPAQLTQSGNAGILFDGTPGLLVYASATQVSAVVPSTLSGSTVQVVAQYQDITSGAVTVQLAAASPALFTADATGTGQAIAVNQDGSMNGASHPAPVGSAIMLFVNGAASSAVSVTIGGQPAIIAGNRIPATALPGVLVVTAQIPDGVQPGNAVPVLIQAAGLTSPSGATIAISGQ